MKPFLSSAIGKLILVNVGVGVAALIGYRDGYQGTDLAILTGVVFFIGNVGAAIGIVMGKFSKPAPMPRGSNWLWAIVGVVWLVYLLNALFPVKK